jgi:hypothetical protein
VPGCALADLERLGFITRIRCIRRITTPLGFTTRQITNAYLMHEPNQGLGLIAMTLLLLSPTLTSVTVAKLSRRRRPEDCLRERGYGRSRCVIRICSGVSRAPTIGDP